MISFYKLIKLSFISSSLSPSPIYFFCQTVRAFYTLDGKCFSMHLPFPRTQHKSLFSVNVTKQKHILCKILHLPKTPEHICKSTKKSLQLKILTAHSFQTVRAEKRKK